MPEIDETDLQRRIGRILSDHPAVGLAVGVIADGRLTFFHGHGVSNIASNAPVTKDTVFRIASISKTFTAVAVMQLWERGLVDLDAPADDYLRAFRLIPGHPDWRPATLRHLLTHTAGIPQMVRPSRVLSSGWFGESFKLGHPLPTLAEHYRGGLRLAAEPGTVFTYSDHSFATVGQIVEDVSGVPLAAYLREHIFGPLGMAATDLLRSERVASRLAMGYVLRGGRVKPVTDRAWVTAAASSIYSTPRDMARYLAALLGGGANQHGRILQPETLATMFAPHYQPDPRVPGMGLGFFRADCGGHPAVEHQGVLPGFHSQIFLAPHDGVGLMAFTNGTRQAMRWLPVEFEALLRHLIGAPAQAFRTDVPHHPELWTGLCGRYRTRAQRTDMQAWLMLGAGADVLVRGGKLTLRILSPIPALWRGFALHPDDDRDPYAFRADLARLGLGAPRIVFSHDPAEAATRIYPEVLPLVWEKRPIGGTSRRTAGGTAGVPGETGELPPGRGEEAEA